MSPPRKNTSTTNSVDKAHGATTRKRKPQDIFEAIAVGDEIYVKDFVEIQRVPLTTLNADKQTAAHVAAQNGKLGLLKYLLQKNASVLKLVDHYGNNVLFWAVQGGWMEMVEYLVDVHQVNITEPNKRFLGNCAVHVAAENGQLAVLKYLVEVLHGDVNVRNEDGEPPMFVAADKTQVHIVKYLVEERKADVTAVDVNDDNVLYLCAKTGKLSLPKYFLDERKINFDINHRNKFGCTVTFTAARFDNLELVKYFVEEKGADINIADENGKTPLHEVASIGYFELVKYFVERGASMELKDKCSNKTVLQTTTDKDILKYLKTMAKKRTPRSVFEMRIHHPSSILYSWMPKKCVGCRDSRQSDETFPSTLDTFVLVASACVNFFTRWTRLQSEHLSLISPAKIIHDKMDPIALEAVELKFSDCSTNTTRPK